MKVTHLKSLNLSEPPLELVAENQGFWRQIAAIKREVSQDCDNLNHPEPFQAQLEQLQSG